MNGCTVICDKPLFFLLKLKSCHKMSIKCKITETLDALNERDTVDSQQAQLILELLAMICWDKQKL